MLLLSSCDGIPFNSERKTARPPISSTNYLSLGMTPLRFRWTIPLPYSFAFVVLDELNWLTVLHFIQELCAIDSPREVQTNVVDTHSMHNTSTRNQYSVIAHLLCTGHISMARLFALTTPDRINKHRSANTSTN
jgi:hypothetical protein